VPKANPATQSEDHEAFLWQNRVVRDLLLPGVLSTAYAINEEGAVVGQRQTSTDIVGQSRTADQENGGPFATLWVLK
jgi:uncharacterized membrane protein